MLLFQRKTKKDFMKVLRHIIKSNKFKIKTKGLTKRRVKRFR